MVRLVLLVGLLVVVLTLALFTFVRLGPDLSMYKSLTEPRITTMADQKMLVVQAEGDPNVVGAKAFEKLFEAYYQIKDAPKGSNQPAPRTRWSQSPDAPPNERLRPAKGCGSHRILSVGEWQPFILSPFATFRFRGLESTRRILAHGGFQND